MILASGMDAASVLIMFGLMQLFSALVYGIPMPVQPLKAVAAIVIAEQIAGPVIYGAGLAIGVVMLLLTTTGLIDWLARVIPKAVIRGIQFGLGAKLALLALKNYVQADGTGGYVLAGFAFTATIFLLGNRKYPPALLVIGFGLIYAFIFTIDIAHFRDSLGFALPQWQTPGLHNILTGLVLLALPQIPLSLGNSILATQQIATDLFPDRNVTVRKIGLTYSLMNLIAPFFSGVPVCHGSGGIAGHYAFGGRTGGSVVIYGALYLILGLLFSAGFAEVVRIFPLPILGVILLFEGLALMRLIADMAPSKSNFSLALLVGILAAGISYGFLVAIIVGTAIYYIFDKFSIGFKNS